MKHTFQTSGTCSTEITFELDGGIVRNVIFTGGCSGNLQAIQNLVNGLTADEIEEKLGGTLCGSRSTSCADQLSQAIRKARMRDGNTAT